jgi:hypothetical protein
VFVASFNQTQTKISAKRAYRGLTAFVKKAVNPTAAFAVA